MAVWLCRNQPTVAEVCSVDKSEVPLPKTPVGKTPYGFEKYDPETEAPYRWRPDVVELSGLKVSISKLWPRRITAQASATVTAPRNNCRNFIVLLSLVPPADIRQPGP